MCFCQTSAWLWHSLLVWPPWHRQQLQKERLLPCLSLLWHLQWQCILLQMDRHSPPRKRLLISHLLKPIEKPHLGNGKHNVEGAKADKANGHCSQLVDIFREAEGKSCRHPKDYSAYYWHQALFDFDTRDRSRLSQKAPPAPAVQVQLYWFVRPHCCLMPLCRCANYCRNNRPATTS